MVSQSETEAKAANESNRRDLLSMPLPNYKPRALFLGIVVAAIALGTSSPTAGGPPWTLGVAAAAGVFAISITGTPTPGLSPALSALKVCDADPRSRPTNCAHVWRMTRPTLRVPCACV
jgi:hypothetical protein